MIECYKLSFIYFRIFSRSNSYARWWFEMGMGMASDQAMVMVTIKMACAL